MNIGLASPVACVKDLYMDSKKDPQIAVYKRLAPWQRLEAACQLYWFAREIIKQRIKRSNPDIRKDELEQKIRKFL